MAANVLVVVTNRTRATRIKILDDGIGISHRPSHGVGLRGMRERLEELGGRLMVRSVPPGTEGSAIMPVKCQNPEVALSGRAKLLELSSKCGRIASKTADDRISAALRGMACDFSTMADWMDREVAA